MKVTLINCNLQDKVPNIGLAYLVSSIEHRHDVKLVDLIFNSKDYLKILRENLKDKPDIVGFSVTSFTFQNALFMARFIKEIYPDTPLILGGVHPTLVPEETIQHPLVDAICIGEGERSFLEYLNALEKGQEPMVPGIWHKDRKGNITRNAPRPFNEDLDDIPFPNWDRWDVDLYLESSVLVTGSLYVLASRGCPYDCSYCSCHALRNIAEGRYYRTRSAENVIKEIKINIDKYADKGLKALYVCDDIFGLDKRFLKEFSDLYIKEGLNKRLPWGCQTRCDIVTDEWARQTRRAGCFLVSLGIESGDDYIRNSVYKKNINRKQICDAATILRDNGIEYKMNFLIGCPEETNKSIKNSLNLIKEMDPFMAYFNFYYPLPKTELGERARKVNPKIEDEEIKRSWNRLAVKPKALNKRRLNRIMWGIRFRMLCVFLKRGLKYKGLRFFTDVINSIIFMTKDDLWYQKIYYMYRDLQGRTIYKYIIDADKRYDRG